MRFVITRVASANVRIQEALHSAIGRGLLVLVGVTQGDAPAAVARAVDKILRVKAFEGSEGQPWRLSVVEAKL
jgi:D-tyrosyl-tRNA(Tyr) deacylase